MLRGAGERVNSRASVRAVVHQRAQGPSGGLVHRTGLVKPALRSYTQWACTPASLDVRHYARVGSDDVNESLSASDALELYRLLASRNVRSWVMGGWGVDALLGRQTRPHHDLDLLVSVDDLGRLQDMLLDHAFALKLIWEGENHWIDVQGTQNPTAFVETDRRGRELDIHVIQLVPGRVPVPLCNVPWIFDDHSLAGVGTIAGAPVQCVSAETQLQMHTGYDLPQHHERDLARLRELVSDATPEDRGAFWISRAGTGLTDR
jgi:lincosamide nucleotidyltransferase A/C/D/E